MCFVFAPFLEARLSLKIVFSIARVYLQYWPTSLTLGIKCQCCAPQKPESSLLWFLIYKRKSTVNNRKSASLQLRAEELSWLENDWKYGRDRCVCTQHPHQSTPAQHTRSLQSSKTHESKTSLFFDEQNVSRNALNQTGVRSRLPFLENHTSEPAQRFAVYRVLDGPFGLPYVELQFGLMT